MVEPVGISFKKRLLCCSGGTESGGVSSGLVFGIPLSQCVENERNRLLRPDTEDSELRRKSRGSFSSLVEAGRPEEVSQVIIRSIGILLEVQQLIKIQDLLRNCLVTIQKDRDQMIIGGL